MSKDDEKDSNQEEVLNPLVFSCSKCRTIVGDSYSLISSDEDHKTLTLSAASNIQRTAELFTSYSSFDEGSTYFCFTCANCQAVLGKYYVTTSRDLDTIREKFTFNVDELSSYELGKSQHGTLPDAIEDDTTNQSFIQGNHESDTLSLEEEVYKIQHVIVDIIRRLNDIESKEKESVFEEAPIIPTSEPKSSLLNAPKTAAPTDGTASFKRRRRMK